MRFLIKGDIDVIPREMNHWLNLFFFFFWNFALSFPQRSFCESLILLLLHESLIHARSFLPHSSGDSVRVLYLDTRHSLRTGRSITRWTKGHVLPPQHGFFFVKKAEWRMPIVAISVIQTLSRLALDTKMAILSSCRAHGKGVRCCPSPFYCA